MKYRGIAWLASLGLMVLSVFGDGNLLYQQGMNCMVTQPARALEFFQQAAGEGHVSSMVGAGHCYENGEGTKVDYARALGFYEQAGKLGSLKAIEGLARIYASCPDPRFHDGAKAVRFAEAVSRKKRYDAGAMTLLAEAYLRNMQVDDAVLVGQKAVKYADDIDQSRILKKQVESYAKGEPVPAKATVEWIMEGANHNVEWAVVQLALMTSDPKDELYNPQLAITICDKGAGMGVHGLLVIKGRLYFSLDELENAYTSFQDAARHGGRDLSGKRALEVEYRKYLKQLPKEVITMAGKLEHGYTRKETYYVTETRISYDSLGNEYDYTVSVPKTRMIRILPNHKAALFLYQIALKKGQSSAQKGIDRLNGRNK